MCLTVVHIDAGFSQILSHTYTRTHIRMHTHTNTQIHTYRDTHTHIHTHTHTHINTHRETHTHTHICIYVARSEKSQLPYTQQQDTLFTIKQ